MAINTGYSAFSNGPIDDMTPHSSMNVPIPAIDSAFSKLEGKLSHQKGVTNPAALAASIGREKYGEKEMAHKSAEGRTAHDADDDDDDNDKAV
jgi:hypothetical protein